MTRGQASSWAESDEQLVFGVPEQHTMRRQSERSRQARRHQSHERRRKQKIQKPMVRGEDGVCVQRMVVCWKGYLSHYSMHYSECYRCALLWQKRVARGSPTLRRYRRHDFRRHEHCERSHCEQADPGECAAESVQ